jgi:hypothetical protein
MTEAADFFALNFRRGRIVGIAVVFPFVQAYFNGFAKAYVVCNQPVVVAAGQDPMNELDLVRKWINIETVERSKRAG